MKRFSGRNWGRAAWACAWVLLGGGVMAQAPEQQSAGPWKPGQPIPEAAIQKLKANPDAAAAFEETFGLKPGEAQQYLGGAQPTQGQPKQEQQAAATGSQQNPAKITSPEEARALPPGAYFGAPDGVVRRRPMQQPSAPTD